MAPAGLVHMNLGDWAEFVGEHLAGERGDDGFLAAKTYRRMHADPGGGYAAGWGLTHLRWSWGEGAVLTHTGSDNTWMSVVFAVPQWDITIVTAANCAGSQGQAATERAKELMMGVLGLRD
jgi:CubicO group peptidase (beta-lactamase class C family)